MKLTALDYALPESLIASTPLAERDASRMMVVDAATGTITHDHVRALAERLPRGALLVVNDTRVIPARLRATKPRARQVSASGFQLKRRSGTAAGAAGICRLTRYPATAMASAPIAAAQSERRGKGVRGMGSSWGAGLATV